MPHRQKAPCSLSFHLKAVDFRDYGCFSVRLKLSSDSSHWKTLYVCSQRAGVTTGEERLCKEGLWCHVIAEQES